MPGHSCARTGAPRLHSRQSDSQSSITDRRARFSALLFAAGFVLLRRDQHGSRLFNQGAMESNYFARENRSMDNRWGCRFPDLVYSVALRRELGIVLANGEFY